MWICKLTTFDFVWGGGVTILLISFFRGVLHINFLITALFSMFINCFLHTLLADSNIIIFVRTIVYNTVGKT